jgi:hypothetical protein
MGSIFSTSIQELILNALKSDDIEFVEEQLNKWRDELLKG